MTGSCFEFMPGAIEGFFVIRPQVFRDARGSLSEVYQKRAFHQAGIRVGFVQENISVSKKNVLRGLHFQEKHPQAKLVCAVTGVIFDVAVDLRRTSPTFGKWDARVLSAENRLQTFIPQGCAHGFCVMSSSATVFYRLTDFHDPEDQAGVTWRDPDLAIPWPVDKPVLSEKDRRLPRFRDLFPAG